MTRSTSHRDRAGITLIEVITTIAILGTFMTLLSFHLVGLSNIWLQGSNHDHFEHHVDGVSLFLNNAFAASESIQAGEGQAAQRPVEWGRPPGWREFDAPLLYFRLNEAPALFAVDGDALPLIHAYVVFENNGGLGILWYSALDARDIDSPNDLLFTPVSTFVDKLEYAYYDRETNRWELRNSPMEENPGEFILPHFLRLTFEHPEHGQRQRSVLIPQKSYDLPLF